MNRFIKVLLILLLSVCLTSCNETEEDDDEIKIDFVQNATMVYEFSGDYKDVAGYAEGDITVTPFEGAKTFGYYLVYYANEDGLLEHYDEVACIKRNGDPVSFHVKDGRFLPPEATLLAVFESNYRIPRKRPVLTDAVDIIKIPENKRIKLENEIETIGMTSDVHINFEELGYGSKFKWKNMLEFFATHKTDYVIITGDMTGDGDIEGEYQYYQETIKNSKIPLENVYESVGNHGNSKSTLSLFTKYTSSSNEVHPYEGSPYYHVVLDNTVLIFMAQELKGPSDSASYENFSKEQIDWLEGLLKIYGNSDKNVFVTIHSPFLNFGPGDRHNGDYVKMITFKDEYVQTMRMKALFETYKDVIILSGHTHLTYYEDENYSDENNSFARMVHVSSGTQTSSYNNGVKLISNTDGRSNNSSSYGSEAYIVKIYEEHIVFIGYNVSTNMMIPAGCLIIPRKLK